MPRADDATIQALRSDLALQIARRLRRDGQTQVAAAKALGIPQPTLSKIMRLRVDELSLELLLRVAVRAGLAVVLQTGKDPTEAGVYSCGLEVTHRKRNRSALADRAREMLIQGARFRSAERQLEAHLEHNKLVNELHRAASAHRKSPAGTAR